MTHAELAAALLQIVRAQRFDELTDHQFGGGRVRHFPSIDLAVIAFPESATIGATEEQLAIRPTKSHAPVFANVLFSREHPQGVVGDIGPNAGAVQNIHYQMDQTDARGDAFAWFPESDWSRMQWHTLVNPNGDVRFVQPYPASLIKLMVAVGIAQQVDLGHAQWQQACTHNGVTHRIADWLEAMLTASSNAAADALVAVLHATGAIQRSHGAAGETVNALHTLFERFGLSTLRLADTRSDGGWRGPAGAGCGHLHMTAWDTARLFWLLDRDATPAPWLAAPAALLSQESRALLRGVLSRQGLHTVLSSGALAGQDDWTPGMPAHMPGHWIAADGGVQVEDYLYPPDVRAANARAEVRFAHKTGGTDNYCSDAGIVTGMNGQRRHYIVALISNMGRRYAAPPDGVVSGKLHALGRAIDDHLKPWLEKT